MVLGRGCRAARRLRFVASLLAAGVGSCIEVPASPGAHDIKIGALLPFSGDLASFGPNAERSMLFAFESVERAGGIDGASVFLLSRDTHSELKRGLSAVNALMFEKEVAALVGPQHAGLALWILERLQAKPGTDGEPRTIPMVSGGVTSAKLQTEALSKKNPLALFRIGPETERECVTRMIPGSDSFG